MLPLFLLFVTATPLPLQADPPLKVPLTLQQKRRPPGRLKLDHRLITDLLDQPPTKFVELSGGAEIWKEVSRTETFARFDKVEKKRVANAFGRGLDERSEDFRFSSNEFILSAFRYGVLYGQKAPSKSSDIEIGESTEAKEVPVSIQGVVATYTGPRFGNTQPTFKEFLGNAAYAKWNLRPYIDKSLIDGLKGGDIRGGGERVILYGQTADSELMIVCDSHPSSWGVVGTDDRYFDPEEFWLTKFQKTVVPNADGIGSQTRQTVVLNPRFDLHRLQVQTICLKKRGMAFNWSIMPFRGKSYVALDTFFKVVGSGDLTAAKPSTITLR